MSAVLQASGLTMAFGGVIAVDDVDFSVSDGELRCIIGPNGAGKSTFFKCVTGQLKPTKGEIQFCGQPIIGLKSHEIARLGIGIKMQVPHLFDGLDVWEHVWLAARRHNGTAAADRIAETVLKRMRATGLALRRVGHLAHGQRQLVELATVLAAEPKLILLDEPAAGMTNDETVWTAELIREINRTATIIVIEHDMQMIRLIADTVTVFHQGGIIMEDHVGAVLRDRTVRDIYLGKQGGM